MLQASIVAYRDAIAQVRLGSVANAEAGITNAIGLLAQQRDAWPAR
jgi:hypothetical protein